MTSPKPGPRLNLIHSQILSALLDNKHLAQNVAVDNIERAAERWIP